MNTVKVETENLMAKEKLICPVLQQHYNLPRTSKERFLDTTEAEYLFNGLPPDVSQMLREGFLSGRRGAEIRGWEVVVDHFQNNSEIIPALTENPGTYTMLEKMYHLQPVKGVIDNYFLQCKAGGQALENRYHAINAKSFQLVELMLKRQRNCMAVDFGSGPGRHAIEMLKRRPDFEGRVSFDCIDIDPAAIAMGEGLVRESGIKKVKFIKRSMTKLHDLYRRNVDFGFLIGVLCGMNFEGKTDLLKVLRHYFSHGGKIIAAALSETMAEEDLLCAYNLRETAGWILQFMPRGEFKKAFEAAGWIYEEYFQDEPTRFYEIGVGINP